MINNKEMNPHEEFGILKNEYSKTINPERRTDLENRMRELLLRRNNGNPKIRLYPTNDVINILEGSLANLYAADATLFHHTK